MKPFRPHRSTVVQDTVVIQMDEPRSVQDAIENVMDVVRIWRASSQTSMVATIPITVTVDTAWHKDSPCV